MADEQAREAAEVEARLRDQAAEAKRLAAHEAADQGRDHRACGTRWVRSDAGATSGRRASRRADHSPRGRERGRTTARRARHDGAGAGFGLAQRRRDHCCSGRDVAAQAGPPRGRGEPALRCAAPSGCCPAAAQDSGGRSQEGRRRTPHRPYRRAGGDRRRGREDPFAGLRASPARPRASPGGTRAVALGPGSASCATWCCPRRSPCRTSPTAWRSEPANVIKSLMRMGVMATVTQSIDAEHRGTGGAGVRTPGAPGGGQRCRDRHRGRGRRGHRPCAAGAGGHHHGPWSTTARPRCWTRCARPTWQRARPAASPSISAPTRSNSRPAPTSPTSTRRATRLSPRCARAAPRSPTWWCWWWRADDGVMPQTIEAIRHAKAANAPIIVAINKIDKPGANPDRVRQELLSHDIVVEAMGGDTQDVEVSATQRSGLADLEEAILLQAEILQLRANPARAAEGSVVREQARSWTWPGGDRAGAERPPFTRATSWWRVPSGAGCAPCSTTTIVRSRKPVRRRPRSLLGLTGVPGAGEPFVVVENEAPGARDQRVPPAQDQGEGRRPAMWRRAAPWTRCWRVSRRVRRRKSPSWSRRTCRARRRRSRPPCSSSSTRRSRSAC